MDVCQSQLSSIIIIIYYDNIINTCIKPQSYSKIAEGQECSILRLREWGAVGIWQLILWSVSPPPPPLSVTHISPNLSLSFSFFDLFACGRQEKHCRLKSRGHDRARWKLSLILPRSCLFCWPLERHLAFGFHVRVPVEAGGVCSRKSVDTQKYGYLKKGLSTMHVYVCMCV